MRVKIVRGRDDRTVHLVYPATLDEYAEAIAALGRVAGAVGDGRPVAGSAGHGLAQDFFVVDHRGAALPVEAPRPGGNGPGACGG